ncbi:MAG TPA: PEP-CTERM sorting domain-containing protein [Phycisphaerae bacterium]|nr:PEP-CTERM sorting domain-containing protein [Phycisphaerae bacterium]
MSQISNSRSFLTQLDKRWLAAGLAATGAGGAMLATPESAHATIVWSGPVNINIPSTTAGVYLNVVTGVSNASPSLVPGWDVNPWSSSTLSYFNPASPAGGVYVMQTGSTVNVANLPFGTIVGPAPGGGRTYGSGSAVTAGADAHILNSDQNLVGFRFVESTLTCGTAYGWMRVSLSGGLATQPRAITEYAYDDTCAPIGAGVTSPEPTTLGLLGLGAAGLLLRRRK